MPETQKEFSRANNCLQALLPILEAVPSRCSATWPPKVRHKIQLTSSIVLQTELVSMRAKLPCCPEQRPDCGKPRSSPSSKLSRGPLARALQAEAGPQDMQGFAERESSSGWLLAPMAGLRAPLAVPPLAHFAFKWPAVSPWLDSAGLPDCCSTRHLRRRSLRKRVTSGLKQSRWGFRYRLLPHWHN